jgi:hypothetical protein
MLTPIIDMVWSVFSGMISRHLFIMIIIIIIMFIFIYLIFLCVYFRKCIFELTFHLTRTFRFYSYGLEKKTKPDLVRDFQEVTLRDLKDGLLYGLEKFWAFLRYPHSSLFLCYFNYRV